MKSAESVSIFDGVCENQMKYVLYIFSLLALAGCSTDERIPLGNTTHSVAPSKVVLIPLDGFDLRDVNEIADYIEKQHKVHVSTYTHMGKNPAMFNAEKQQYLSEEIAQAAWRVLHDNGDADLSKAVIVLTRDDINTGDFRFRYFFSNHFEDLKLSVISTARIDPINYGLPADHDLKIRRLEKLVNKSLGLHLYGYKNGTDKSSVMYGPIMGVEDLDSVGDWYGATQPQF